MSQPEDFVDPHRPSHVCKLNHALYGLKQAPRAWYERLKNALVSWGFLQGKADNSLFFLHSQVTVIFILVYVDDIIITSNRV